MQDVRCKRLKGGGAGKDMVLLRVLVALLIAAVLGLMPASRDIPLADLPPRAHAAETGDGPAGTVQGEVSSRASDDVTASSEGEDQESAPVDSEGDLKGMAADKADGTYYGTGEGYQSVITAAVSIENGRITKIDIVSHADDQTYLEHAEKLIANIIDLQSIDGVDVVSGATYSSQGILEATGDALTGSGTVAVTNSAWFGAVMTGAAALLMAAAAACAWMRGRVRGRANRARATRLQQLSLQAMFFILTPASFASGFMGVKSALMQFQVMGQRGYDFQISSFMILLAGLVVFTALFGRFYCGYACAFGLFGDLLYGASEALTRKFHVIRRPLPRRLELALRGLKYVALVAIAAAIGAGFISVVNGASPWTAFSSLTNLSVAHVGIAGAVMLGVIVAGMLWKERFFCEFLCPLGAIFSLIPTFRTGRMRRRRPQCVKGCAACRDHCPVSIEPKGKVLAGECILCGRCAEVCPVHNVTLGLELREDQVGERTKQGALSRARLVLTSRPVAILWKAALLLLMLWLMKATRFLPPPPT